MGAFASVVILVLCIAIAAGYRAVQRLSPIDPLPLVLPRLPPATGVYSRNAVLQGIERIGVGQLLGPEDIAVDNHGRLYVGCADGWVYRIWPDGKIEKWVHVNGRPLGLSVGIHQELLVCDPVQGLLNVTEENVEVLSNEADGVKFRLTDAVAVASDGTIYFTDASHKHGLEESTFDILECGSNGRLLKYDPFTQSTTVLLKDLFFANGVALSTKQDFLVFCETTLARCQRYWLEGQKKGTVEVFIDNLPGHPDNIKNDGKGMFWIAFVVPRTSVLDFIHKFPFVKQLMTATKLFRLAMEATSKGAWVLEVSEQEGEAVRLLGDPESVAIRSVTTAMPVGDDYLYLGSLHVDFVGRLNLTSTTPQ